jgi:hypothetical protein
MMCRIAAAAGIVLALSASSLATPSVAHACYGPPTSEGGTAIFPGPPSNGPCASWANDPRSPYRPSIYASVRACTSWLSLRIGRSGPLRIGT